jgi:ubiquinone/menaquinone biosynthesis C-methylase UbiE
MSAGFTLETNREYWERPDTISIIDKNLHQLEIQFVLRHLRPDHTFADIGCGNGDATAHYAAAVKQCVAIERSSFLRERAAERIAEVGLSNVTLVEGDLLDLSAHVGAFDVVLTQRSLINLPSWDLQKQALGEVYRALRPGGLYVMIENTNDANDVMNDYRGKVGLPPIPKHWHNLFLDMPVFTDFIQDKFTLVERHGFSLYYLLTRVYVQMFASFTGSGKDAVADPIFAHSDRAARLLHEAIGDKIQFLDNPVFGPIQGMVLAKKG